MRAELAAAIGIFRELGWQDAAVQDLRSLPLGDVNQQKTALAGLRRGAWGSFGEVAPNSFRWVPSIDVDATRLGVFAIRLGADARRTIDVLTGVYSLPDSILAEILAQRGPAFAEEFVRLACVARRRAWTHATSAFGGTAVRLVHMLELEVPRSVEYLKDWSAFAAAALGGPAEIFPEHRERIDADVIRGRFVEHVTAAVEGAQPATASFGVAFRAGVEAGWMPVDIAAELAFTGLETAQRPGDRVVWVRIITDTLGVDDAGLAARTSAIIPTLATGDAAVVEALAPRLIAASDEAQLVEVAAAALTVRSKNARLAVLGALAERPKPRAEGADDVVAQLRLFVAGKDAAVGKAAQKALEAWGGAAPVEMPSTEGRGVWSVSPDVWEVPRFEQAPVSSESLAAAAGRLMIKPESVHDIDAETFLDVLIRSAYADIDRTRSALRGVRSHGTGGLYFTSDWVAGDLSSPRYVTRRLLLAREHELLQLAGLAPVMLSTPSWIDMRIDPEHLLTRVRAYADAGAPAAASDLLLAMTRLDLALFTDAHRRGFAEMDVAVIGRDDAKLSRSAGEAILAYVADPIVEPAVERRRSDGAWRASDLVLPASLDGFPDALERDSWYRWHDGVIFPGWADAVGAGFESYPLPDRGLALRQGARRAAPYSAPVAVRLIGALRQLHPRAAEDAYAGVSEAFERGLLRPEAMDATYLDPVDLASLASACLDLADEGMTSVVLPLLDGLIEVSLEGSRMLSGTADLADAVAELLPIARGAVESGIAPPDVLALPGIRALARRPGGSKAVVTARAATSALAAVEPSTSERAPKRHDPKFDEIWTEASGRAPGVIDDAILSAEWADPDASTKILVLDLRLADHPGDVFRVVKGAWNYDLENEGQCSATRWPEGGDPAAQDYRESQVSLSWDGTRLIVHPRIRNGAPAGPLTSSMHAAVLAALCHDGDHGSSGIHLVRVLMESELMGWRGVRHAIRLLLEWRDVSPARMMRAMEKEPRTRAVLWPVITESIAVAAKAETLPPWINRVLDVATIVAPQVLDAVERGWLPPEVARFDGLREIAARTGSQAAIRKSADLLASLPI